MEELRIKAESSRLFESNPEKFGGNMGPTTSKITMGIPAIKQETPLKPVTPPELESWFARSNDLAYD